jgi:hypothetical protein
MIDCSRRTRVHHQHQDVIRTPGEYNRRLHRGTNWRPGGLASRFVQKFAVTGQVVESFR